MLRVRANYHYLTLAFDHFAFIAHWFYGRTYLHIKNLLLSPRSSACEKIVSLFFGDPLFRHRGH